MTSPQFIEEFIEYKLKKRGIKKIVPDDDLLAKLYSATERGLRLQELVEDLDVDMKDHEVPKNLRDLVIKHLKTNPEQPWDVAVAQVLKKQR